jgi:mono/diheme cytochrome c family protein
MTVRDVFRVGLMAVAAVCLWSAPALSQTTSPAVKKEVAPRTSPSSGVEMFNAYCAACHGGAGKGDGPAAASLKTKPANLSELAKNNRGNFPIQRVEQTLRFGVQTPAHGSSDMPTWGDTFRVMGDEGTVRLRIANLIDYLKTLQVK